MRSVESFFAKFSYALSIEVKDSILFTDVTILKSIKSECGDEVRFVKSTRGAANLMDKQGHVYYKHKNSPDSSKIHWDCRDRRKYHCHGRATTEGFKIVKFINDIKTYVGLS